MSNLREKIRNSKATKKELVATTVRIPEESLSVIDELSNQLGLSKQQMLLDLIEEGIAVAEDELGLKETETQMDSKFYIVNTNKKNCVQDGERMLREGIVAAFYGGWKELINGIKDGDVVLLYENAKGIIAYGKGTGKTLETDYYGEDGEMRYQHLEGFTVLVQPLSASEIKKILNREIVFLQTITPISEGGQKLLDRCIAMAS
ncbi:MAG: hypothetical protein GY795_18845 [Desulfobacterales bacterium]|nr:hypothetical protein [Desulfobacterales bacterium]